MGFDSRFFGPSAWQLLHLISFQHKDSLPFLKEIWKVLPCKFCRESTKQYSEEISDKEPGKWMYELHNRVNKKLRDQCKKHPEVVDPGEDPFFEEVKQKYDTMKITEIPGRDLLFSIAINYQPTEENKQIQNTFINDLARFYPFTPLRKEFQDHIQLHPILLDSKKSYMKWMYAILKKLAEKVDLTDFPTYKGYVQHVMYYKSGCAKKTYRGVTCRKTMKGGLTKNRDHEITRRQTHKKLL